MSNLSNFLSAIKAGDVIAFSGRGVISSVIKYVTRSPYSHVAIIIDVQNKQPLLMESTTLSTSPDLVSGVIEKGVQLHRLTERMAQSDAQAWWLPLVRSIPDKPLKIMQNWLYDMHKRRVPYDNKQAIASGVDFLDGLHLFAAEPDFSSLFCSELVGKALQLAGVIPGFINPSEQTPADIVRLPCFAAPLGLL